MIYTLYNECDYSTIYDIIKMHEINNVVLFNEQYVCDLVIYTGMISSE